MVLESLRPGGPVNIHHLVIESPLKPDSGLPFDAKRDITKSDLRAMDEKAKADIKDRVFYRSDILVCASLKLLFPNRQLPIDDFNDQGNFELVKDFVDLGLAVDVLAAKILYPQVQIEDYGKVGQARFKRMLDDAHDYWIKRDMSLYELADLKMFNPEGIADILADDGFKDYVLKDVQKRRVDQNWYHLGLDAASARVILGDDFDLEISKTDWQGMHKELEDLRAGNAWYVFAELARNMQILAAEKVRVTPNEGLVLVMPKPKEDFKAEIPPLPQMRRF